MSDPKCQRCKEPYCMRYGDEPSRYCNGCAHFMVEKLASKARTLSKRLKEAREAYRSAMEALK